jgi:hypothetical protein
LRFDVQDNTGDKVISTRNRMGLIGFLSVLAGMAVIFGAEEGLVEEKAWSNEMAAIENATKQRDTGKFRYALMDDMTWNLAKEACSAISNEYELCTVSELCSQTEDGLKAHTLCQPQSQCDGLEAVGGFRNRWAPVQKDGGASDGEWVHVEKNCQVCQRCLLHLLRFSLSVSGLLGRQFPARRGSERHFDLLSQWSGA